MAVDKTQIRSVNSQWYLLDGSGGAVQLGANLTIGRETDNALVLTEGAISRNHARIDIIAGTPVLTDLDSSNGSFVNGKRVEKAELKAGDQVRFDTVEFELSTQPERQAVSSDASDKTVVYSAATQPETEKTQVISAADSQKTEVWQAANVADGGTLIMSGGDMPKVQRAGVSHASSLELQGIDDPVAGRSFSLNKDSLTVGRSPLNDIIIKTNSVSSQHAHFEQRTDGWYLVDDGSSNGTYVNGHSIDESPLKSGDRVKFGDVQLDFDPAGAKANPGMQTPTTQAAASNHTTLFVGIGGGILVVLVAIAWLLMQKPSSAPAENTSLPVQAQLQSLWSVSLDKNRIFMGPVVSNVRDDALPELVFTDDRGKVSIFDSRTGQLLNEIQGNGVAFAVPPLAVTQTGSDQQALLVTSIDGQVSLLNGRGQTLWSNNLGPAATGVFAKPLLIEDQQQTLIAVPTMGRGVVLMQASDGRILWDTQATGSNDIITPVVGNREQLNFVSQGGQVFAVSNQRTASQLSWQSQLPEGELPLSLQSTGTQLLSTTGEGTLTLINQANGEIVWQKNLGQVLFSKPFIAGGNVFAVDQQGTLHMIELGTGNTIQQSSLAAPVQADITAWGEQMLIADGHGKLHKISNQGLPLLKQRANGADEFVQSPWVGDLDNDGEIDLVVTALNGTMTRYLAP